LIGIAARWWQPVAAAAIVFGAEYAVYLRLDTDAVDARAPLVAAALVGFVELAFRAAAFRGGRGERALLIREAAAVTVAAFGAALVAGILLVAAGTFGSSLMLEVLGAAAGVLAIGVVAQVARIGSSTST
jgi:hypothetical protein